MNTTTTATPGKLRSPRRRRTATAVALAIMLGASLLTAKPASADSVDERWRYIDLNITGTYTPITGYFNHDKITDILWYGPGAITDSLWLGTTTPGTFSKRAINVGGSYRPIVGDFALDGYTDILWYGFGTRPDVLWAADGSTKFFKSIPKTINGEYYLFSAYGANVWDDGAGGYTMRDLGFGKDDIMFLGGSYGPESYMKFNDNGDGGHTSAPLSISANYVPIRGNFSGGNGYDDVVLYRPGTKGDYLWISDGTGKFTQKSVTVNGQYQPVAIARNPLNADPSSTAALDSILWFDNQHCGKSNPIWHFNSSGSWSTRGGNVVPQFGEVGCDEAVARPLEGTSSAVAYRQWCYDRNGYTTPVCYDYQVFDRDAGSSVGWLTPGDRDFEFDWSGPSNAYLTGDFNGDSKADIFWYQAGTARDEIWYGREAMVRNIDQNAFEPRTNPDGIPAAPYQ